MESGIQSSFIPHDAATISIAPRPSAPGMNRGLAELALLLSIVLLVSSAALAAAVFLYGQYVQSSATSKLDQLQRAKAAFEPSLIQQLTRLDDRMNAAEQVIQAHVAPSAFFDALQQSTLTTVSFTTLNLEVQDAQHMNLKMTGVAQSVNSIALQADLFSKSGVIENPIFTDITRQADGVHFNVSAVLNPAMVSYEHFIAAEAANTGAASGQMQTTPITQPAQQTTTPQQTPTQTQTAPAQGTTSASTTGGSPFQPRTQ